MHDGPEVGHAGESKNMFQVGGVAGNFAVLEAVSPAPHRVHHELGDESLGRVASVVVRRGQASAG